MRSSAEKIAWPDMEVIDLSKERLRGEAIEFLRVELPGGWDRPFALVRYAEEGKEQEYGLRLDRDKGVFLDHLNNPDKEKFVQSMAPEVLRVLLERAPDEGYLSDEPQTVDLRKVPKVSRKDLMGPGIELLRVELPGGWQSPFGLIRYADESGKELEHGVPLDLDKEALLHHTGNEKADKFLQEAVPLILYAVRRSMPTGERGKH